ARARREARESFEIDVRADGHATALGVEPQDRRTAVDRGESDGQHPVETAGAEERRVQLLGPVRRADHDHALGRRETVHLDEELVQRAVVLVVRAVPAPPSAERVDLIDEDHPAATPGLAEERPDPVRAEPDDETGHLRSRDMEERYVRLARDRADEERLPGPGRAAQQHACRDPRAHRGERLRSAEEIDDLAELFRAALRPGDVGEGRLRAIARAPDLAALAATEVEEDEVADFA